MTDALDWLNFKDYMRSVDALLAKGPYFKALERQEVPEDNSKNLRPISDHKPKLSEPAPKREYELL